jgi:cell wall-associated NlpC family hydrolase
MTSKTTAPARPMRVNWAILAELQRKMMGRVKYELGAKAGVLSRQSAEIASLDCSGFVQYVIFKTCGLTIPEGSVQQRDWLQKQGYRRVSYAQTARLRDGILRLAFFPPVAGKRGHVWFVLNGKTIECYSGKGVNSRAWWTPKLKNNVAACFEIGVERVE